MTSVHMQIIKETSTDKNNCVWASIYKRNKINLNKIPYKILNITLHYLKQSLKLQKISKKQQ